MHPHERISHLFSITSRLMVTTSGGRYSYVLPYLIAQAIGHKTFPIVFVDTGFYPSSTYHMIEGLKRDGFQVDIRTPELTPSYIEAIYGDINSCDLKTQEWLLDKIKTNPLNHAFETYEPLIWIRGIRRDESHIRKDYPFVWERNGVFQVYPILDWTEEDVQNFLLNHDLPENPEHFDITKGSTGKRECPIGERCGTKKLA